MKQLSLEMREPVDKAKVDACVSALKAAGFKVQRKLRKMAAGEKMYLIVKGSGGHYTVHHQAMPIVHRHFPLAYTTSGGYSDDFHITISLTGDR